MHSKWNNKINQVTENTLVVGMDIAKRIHYACFVDERGRVIEKAFAVHQSKEGFENLYERILQTYKVHNWENCDDFGQFMHSSCEATPTISPRKSTSAGTDFFTTLQPATRTFNFIF